MTLMSKTFAVPALVGLLSMSSVVQAEVVSDGFVWGDGIFDSGTVSLDAGDYSLDLTAFTFGPAGPFIFGITNTEAPEAFQVSVAEFGAASFLFSTVGGVFNFLVGGDAGDGAIYEASVNTAPVPLPPSILMLGSAAAAMFSIRRRAGKTEVVG